MPKINMFPVSVPMIANGMAFYKTGIYGTADALDECLKAGYEPLFMPEMVDAENMSGEFDICRMILGGCVTPSVMVTGKGKPSNVSHKGGTEFVVYAHVPNYYSNPDNIRKQIRKGKLVNGAGIFPQKEFDKLLDMADDERIFAIGYGDLKNSQKGPIPISEALRHPYTVPYLGGYERAEARLEKYEKYGIKTTSIRYSDDLAEQPLGRLLVLGFNGNVGCRGDGLDLDGRFVGIKAANAPPKPRFLQQLLQKIRY